MLKVKMFVAPCLVTFILSAASVAPASGDWFVGGTKLATGATAHLASKAAVDAGTIIRINNEFILIKVLCKGSLLGVSSAEIEGPSGARAQSLDFEQCETIEPKSSCALTSPTIETQPVKITAQAGSKAPEDRIIIAPATKTVLVGFNFETSCPIKEWVAKGPVTMRAPAGQTEAATFGVEELGSNENNSLEGAGVKTYLEGGKFLLALASGSKWSFH